MVRVFEELPSFPPLRSFVWTEGTDGAVLQVLVQPVVFAEVGGAELEDGFGSGRVPELLAPFDSAVELLDQ